MINIFYGQSAKHINRGLINILKQVLHIEYKLHIPSTGLVGP